MDTADRFIDDVLAAMRGSAPAPLDPRTHPALRNLLACYRKAQKEPLARIPSYLEAAIQNLEALLK